MILDGPDHTYKRNLDRWDVHGAAEVKEQIWFRNSAVDILRSQRFDHLDCFWDWKNKTAGDFDAKESMF
jgi:hypothetical protein